MANLAVIIVASGSSRRMGIDKLTLPLQGKPVLQHSLDAFQYRSDAQQVILVTPLERWQLLKTTDKVIRVEGGSQRHDSVQNGLQHIAADITHIAIHDAARPLISQSQINAVFSAALRYKAATSARRITDTVKRSNDTDFTTANVNREHLWAMETPQIFEHQLLKQAYAKVTSNNLVVTDEVSALEHISYSTKLIHNPTPNLKITHPEDMEQAAQWFNKTK